MSEVIIHIFPGISTDPPGAFDEMRSQGIDQFKNFLFTVLGHVGISFPSDTIVYGYGPNITQEDLDNLRPFYQNKRRSDLSREKTKWTALNFLFYKKSPVFDGIISNDTQFFNEHEHIKIPLKLGTGYNTETALETLKGITAQYGSPYLNNTKENCLTAIFNHLPLTYPDGKPVVLSTVYMLRQTLKELQENSNSKESSGAAGKKGGRRRKTKRKKRKSKRKKRRRKRKRKTKRRR